MNIIRAYGIEEDQILHDIISNANRNGRLSLCYIIYDNQTTRWRTLGIEAWITRVINSCFSSFLDENVVFRFTP